MASDPAMWDERFRARACPYGEEPSLFLRERLADLPGGGLVLLPGDGGGRNGVWLARHGFRVHLLDFSAQGLQTARWRAEQAGVEVVTEQADVTTWVWPERRYDAVVSVYLHLPPPARRVVHRAMVRALKPGGFLLLEAFHVDQMAYSSGGPRDPAQLFTEDALREDLAMTRIQVLRRDEVVLEESDLHRGPAVLMRVAARAPGDRAGSSLDI